MKTSITKLLIGATLASGLAFALPSYAMGPDGFPGCGRHAAQAMANGDPSAWVTRMMDRLNLSTEQRTAVQAVVDRNAPQLRDIGTQLKANHQQIHDLATQGTPDPAQVRVLADAQGKLMADMIVLRTQMHSDISALLTDQQRQQFQQMHQGKGHAG
jgi:Spy/CpxP family protein refolding chaperone